MQVARRIFTWLFVTVFCLLYLSLFINPGIFLLQHNPKAMDFLAFYTGAQLLSWSPANLYNLHVQNILQQQMDPITKTNGVFLPFLNPPFVAFLFQTIAFFGFINAYLLLLGINIAVLLLICFIATKLNNGIKWYYIAAFIIGTITFIPVLITLLVGQLSIVLCAIFLFAWLSLKNGKEFRSGLILSLVLIKPHFFLLPLLAILVQRRIKLVTGFIVGVLALMAISYWCVGWTGMNSYFQILYSFYNTGTGYNINLMAQQTLQTLLLIIFHTQSLDHVRLYWIIAILIIIIPTLFVWSKKFPYSSSQFSLQFALLILATIITSPHTHFYDLSLLLVVTVLLLSQMKTFKKKQKKLFILLIIGSYCIPLAGYCLFVWLQDSTQGMWVVPNVVYLILFWLILFKELVSLKGGDSFKAEAD
jgi:hypothetical protein